MASVNPYSICSTPNIDRLLGQGSPVAIGVSGGKDSSAVALRVADYLRGIGHHGPKLLVHSDLGAVEWKDSLPTCERLAARIGWELLTVRRKNGDMMERWEVRWQNNVTRYGNLDCVKLILPWSTPSMRFCTSELKTDVICSALTKRFPGSSIINVTGIRHAESPSRARMPTAMLSEKLSRRGCDGWSWNAIIEWSTEAVYSYLEEQKESLHEAYRLYGSSRVSCAFCIMGSGPDLTAAATCSDNHDIYRRMVELEIASTFAFQGSRWLGDVAPGLLDATTRSRLEQAKEGARLRVEAETSIPHHLLFTGGRPLSLPTPMEADVIAATRQKVADAVNLSIPGMTGADVMARYSSLLKAA